MWVILFAIYLLFSLIWLWAVICLFREGSLNAEPSRKFTCITGLVLAQAMFIFYLIIIGIQASHAPRLLHGETVNSLMWSFTTIALIGSLIAFFSWHQSPLGGQQQKHMVVWCVALVFHGFTLLVAIPLLQGHPLKEDHQGQPIYFKQFHALDHSYLMIMTSDTDHTWTVRPIRLKHLRYEPGFLSNHLFFDRQRKQVLILTQYLKSPDQPVITLDLVNLENPDEPLRLKSFDLLPVLNLHREHFTKRDPQFWMRDLSQLPAENPSQQALFKTIGNPTDWDFENAIWISPGQVGLEQGAHKYDPTLHPRLHPRPG